MSELVFLRSAETDIQAAYEFYDAYQEGRGEIFLRHLDATLGQIRIFPKAAPVFHGTYRRRLLPGFPYGVFYALEGSRLIVLAVVDLRQIPKPFAADFGSDNESVPPPI